MTNYSELLKNNRLEKNLTLEDISSMTGISKSYLSRIESGERNAPSVHTWEKIDKALNITYLPNKGIHEMLKSLNGYLLMLNKKGEANLKEVIDIMEKVDKIIEYKEE